MEEKKGHINGGFEGTPTVIVVDTETGLQKTQDVLDPDEEFQWRVRYNTHGRGRPGVNYNCHFGQGIAFMVAGVCEICVSSPLTYWLFQYNYIAFGIWCACIWCITGVFGIFSGIWKYYFLTIIYLLMCIMSICSSSTIIVLSALGDWTYDYESCPELTTHCGGKNAATAVQLCFGGIGWVLSAYSFYFLFLTLICGNRMEDD